MLHRIRNQLVEHQRQRDSFGFFDQAGRPVFWDVHGDGVLPNGFNTACDGVGQFAKSHRRKGASSLQPMDHGNTLHLADRLVDRLRDHGVIERMLPQYPDNALQVVLDPMVDFSYQQNPVRGIPRLLQVEICQLARGDVLVHSHPDLAELVVVE